MTSLVFSPFKLLFLIPFSRHWAVSTYANSEMWSIGPKWWQVFRRKRMFIDLPIQGFDGDLAIEHCKKNGFDWEYKGFSFREDILPQISGVARIKCKFVRVPTTDAERERARRIRYLVPAHVALEYKYVPMLRIQLSSHVDMVKLGLILK